jgi:hypothetical protein
MLSLSIESHGAVGSGDKATVEDEWSDWCYNWEDRGDEEEENESLLSQSFSSTRDYYKKTEVDSSLTNKRRKGRIRYSVIILIASLAMALVLFRLASRSNEQESSPDMANDINATNTNAGHHHDFKAEVDNEYNNNNNNNNMEPNTNNQTLTETVILKDAIANDPSLLENPIIQILQIAKVHNITLEEFLALPQTFRNFQTLYHSDEINTNTSNTPIIIGLERCQEYRDVIAPDVKDRYAAVAGMFNTGNNAFELAMLLNLQKHQQHKYVGKLPWGRHRMEQDRLKHVAPGFENLNQTQCLPVLIIRDPLHWMHSMVCRLHARAFSCLLAVTAPFLCLLDTLACWPLCIIAPALTHFSFSFLPRDSAKHRMAQNGRMTKVAVQI